MVANKCDLPLAPGPRPAIMAVSAATSAGVDELCQEIANRLVPHPLPPGAAVPFLPEHVETVRGYVDLLLRLTSTD